MSTELDMSQYRDLFLQEADEMLEVLEQETLKLETDPALERLQSIFRAAHTLKGSSRAMGFDSFAQLTHEMENLLDRLRAGQQEVTTDVTDVLLGCLDRLGQMKDAIAEGGSDKLECNDLVERLQVLIAEGGAEAPTPKAKKSKAKEEAAAPAESEKSNDYDARFTEKLDDSVLDALKQAQTQAPVYIARFVLSEECVMKYVRSFMAISVVQESGELLATLPDQEKLEEEKFDNEFELFFQSTESPELIKSKFAGIGEVVWYDVRPWLSESGAEVEATATADASTPTVEEEKPEAAETKTPEPAKPAGPAQKKYDTGQTVRVDVARLDELMNLVGELVIDRTRVAQIGAVLAAKYDFDENIEALAETVGHVARITSDLQDQIMKARMLPIETVFNRFPRMVRDLAHKIGKDIKLELEGGETELDRSVIEVIGDPLMHILRNSVDHGVEMPEDRTKAGKPAQGKVVVSARHQENHIVIEITDDGKGIDVERVKAKALQTGVITKDQSDRMSEKEALQLIFASGLSTAEKVTDVSGRGVGMDVVRSNIQKLGGIIDLETTMGEGSKFSLRLPLTLAIIRGLLVRVSGVVYVLPLGSVIETMLMDKADIQSVAKREVVVIRGMTTPLVRLRKVFSSRNYTAEEKKDQEFVVIVGLAEQRVGLVVDSLVGEQEVVIKSLNRFCGDVRGVSGATILGDGNVALITDVNGIIAKENSS
ncbi:MAG: chemotaxis protein CheA [Fimbriimonadaceae bacterium]|nr:chemotaxis protein CheA [Fimbriimonadaceae bacterium]